MIGIYRILNKENGDFYIGSAINLEERFRRHKRDLRKGSHHSPYLQRAWDKYGSDMFVFEIIEYCERDNMIEREDFYLLRDKPVYNICPRAYSSLGRKLSEEHIDKLKKYAKDNNIRPPKETYEKRQKPVIMIDYHTGAELFEFKSLSEACRYVQKDCTYASTISAVCKGKRNSAFGYKWKFKE